MTDESPTTVARRVAASLRAACEVDDAFGVDERVLPPRRRPEPAWPARAARRPAEPPSPDTADLDTLREIVEACTRCHLHETRTQTVFGAGSPDADLVVVGEAPGAEEDRTGVPFVGRAGQLLTKMLAAIDLERDAVFICNTLKCRPPGNKTPDAGEIAACLPYLRRQIELLKPKVVLALGSPAARTLLETREGITRIRGRIFPRFGAKVVPSFHPAYLLRNPAAKREAWEDLKLVRRLLDE
jgi:DNA polymerase